VAVSHTGHREVFTISDEMHLSVDVNKTSRNGELQERTGSRRRVRTLLPQVGDKDPSGISYNRHRIQAPHSVTARCEVCRSNK